MYGVGSSGCLRATSQGMNVNVQPHFRLREMRVEYSMTRICDLRVLGNNDDPGGSNLLA
jgi:hypothetical protein